MCISSPSPSSTKLRRSLLKPRVHRFGRGVFFSSGAHDEDWQLANWQLESETQTPRPAPIAILETGTKKGDRADHRSPLSATPGPSPHEDLLHRNLRLPDERPRLREGRRHPPAAGLHA